MDIKDIFKMAMIGLSTNKVRSILTILGIVIGITAVTIVTSLGDSAEGYILGEIENFGSNSTFIIPGKGDLGESSILTDSLNDKDVEALSKKSNVPMLNLLYLLFLGRLRLLTSQKNFIL